MSEKALANQARLDRCAEIIAAVQAVPSNEEMKLLKMIITAHKAFACQLETVAVMLPNHPDVAELINLRDEITTKLEVVSEILGLSTTP